METQISGPSTSSTVRRTTVDDVKFSKKYIKCLASMMKDPYQPRMVKQELEKYHSQGNEYFKNSQWNKAVERYSRCVQFGLPFTLTGTVAGSEIKRNIVTVAASNRTQALLNQRLWDKALRSAEEALRLDPQHVKSLYRKARALEGLQDYKRARPVLEYALELSPNNKTIKDALDQCNLLYHQSVTGEYDLARLLCRGGPAPIFSDFVGPVEIKLSTYAGRGLFLTEAVEPGRLLLVSNALALGGSERNERWELFASLADEMLFMCQSSERSLYQLHYLRSMGAKEGTRAEEIPPLELFIPGSDWSPDRVSKLELPSRVEVWGQALVNSFDAQQSILPLDFGGSRNEFAAPPNQMTVIGVWTLPSFMNHSCAPNCSSQTVGRAMFVRAAESMPAGQELTISYASSHELDREKELLNWNFKCKCERCLHDKQIRPLIQELLDDVEKQISDIESSRSTQAEEALQKSSSLVDRIEDTIKNLPIELGERQKNWIRFTFLKVYVANLRFRALLTLKENIFLLKRILGGYESINISVSGLHVQLAASILHSVEAEYGKSSLEYEEARRDLERQFKKSLGNVKEAETEEMLKSRFFPDNLWFL